MKLGESGWILSGGAISSVCCVVDDDFAVLCIGNGVVFFFQVSNQ